MGEEAEEAQKPQHILVDALKRIADELDAPGRQIGDAAERVIDHPVRPAGQGIDGEVAARGVGDPVIGELHPRPAAVGLDVAAQRGDLEALGSRQSRHGPMLDPGRQSPQPGLFEQLDHLLRRIGRGDVDVRDGAMRQPVAHAAADEADAGTLGLERGDDGQCLLGVQPRLRRQFADRLVFRQIYLVHSPESTS